MHDIYLRYLDGELRRLGSPRMSKIYSVVPPPSRDPKPRTISQQRAMLVRAALKLWIAKGNKL